MSTIKTREAIKLAILEYWATYYSSPTIREIASSVTDGMKSASNISYHLVKLREEGWLISKEKRLTRGLVPTQIAQIIKEGLNGRFE